MAQATVRLMKPKAVSPDDLDVRVACALGWVWVSVPRPNDRRKDMSTGFYWTPYVMRDGSDDVSRELDLPNFSNAEWQGTLTNFLAGHRITYALYFKPKEGWLVQNEGGKVVVPKCTSIGEALCRLIVGLHEKKLLLTRKQRIANLYADIKARRENEKRRA